MPSRKAYRHAKRLDKVTTGSSYPHLPLRITPGDPRNHYKYMHMTNRQLKKIFNSRGLRRPLQFHRSTYIRLLKAADEKYQFRFTDLPPEIRNMVYKYVTWCHGGWGNEIPDICFVSQNIRNETMAMHFANEPPVFYIDNNYHDSWGIIESPCQLDLPSQYRLGGFSDEHAEAMTAMSIITYSCRHTENAHTIEIAFQKTSPSQSNVKPRITGYKTTLSHSNFFGDSTCTHPIIADFLKRNLSPLLDSIVGRSGAAFCKQDLCDILRVFVGPCLAAPTDSNDP